MKKHINILAFALSIAVLSALTGCDNTENPDSIPNSSASDDVNDSDDSDSGDIESESIPGDDRETIISEMKLTVFEGPDGEEIYAEDADEIYRQSDKPVLKYNFAYIRYAGPYFYAGDVPDDEEREEWLASIPKPEWFKVRAGDTLECGLTVKKAEYVRYGGWGSSIGLAVLNNDIEFDGEITLDGILYMSKNSNDYLTRPGDLVFTPDPTKTSGIPAISGHWDNTGYNIYHGMSVSENDNIKYVMADIGSTGWVIKAPDDVDKNEIFGDNELVFVRVTLTNVKAGGYVNPDIPAIFADIVEIERID